MKKTYYIMLLILFSTNTVALNLNVGAFCNGENSDKSVEENDAAAVITEYFTLQNKSIFECLGWLKTGAQSDWFFVNGDLSVHSFNVTTKKHTGPWLLTRWIHLNIPAEYLEAEKYFTPKSQTVGDASYSQGGSIGCLSNSPLRYGNVLGTTENDIMLTLNSQLFIFSPTYKRVVFEEYYDHSDWLHGDSTDRIRAGIRIDSQDQYISGLYTGLPAARTGYRGYSKLFIGDYDKDGNTDILVWRKIYRSNNKSNSVKGFTLIRNEWQHFERDLVAQAGLAVGVTGEFLPQLTDATTIQTWLSENQLTWQKGYPSLSECAGQETQLIPEMHDLLLNDPEVLQ